ncbi:hydroxyacylglutathione hydrolase [Pendulispora rubella]|uniref:Hydroxyacylglutathione hydrolase n=1 Tax=Pendulispora rubella TaxID=2741070 RepID=A0ABZ2KRA8_9BACT
MKITSIPCLSDNYAYLVECETTGEKVLVDASEAAPILAALESRGVRKLASIWSTHHHFDHVGANEAVASALGVREIAGHASDKGRIPGQTRFLEEGETFSVGDLRVAILHIPGHTTGAVAYVVSDDAKGTRAVFTGDTLFLGGCGRLFEGTPAMMHTSLSKLAALPGDTEVYCGHEYTKSNLRFAAHVEPNNAAIRARAEHTEALRTANEPTVPGRMSDELATNPFLRVRSAEIRSTLGIAADASDADALGAIRAAKDKF